MGPRRRAGRVERGGAHALGASASAARRRSRRRTRRAARSRSEWYGGDQQEAVLMGGAPHPARTSKTARRGDGTLCAMHITPHIVVQGAERAGAFYRDAFGAVELSRIPTPDGRLMPVQLRIGDSLMHLADEFPEIGVLAAQAVAAGAEVRQPLADTFWGDLHGQLDDPFGHRW